LKVLTIHTAYQQRGGEEVSLGMETAALRRHGVEVIEYFDHNHRVSEFSRLGLALNTIWSVQSRRRLLELLLRERPDVAYVNNTFPLISPSAYYACAAAGVPVVQVLRNFRLLCPPGTLLREDRVCEDCVGHLFPWPAVVHACYRHSRAATTTAAAMLAIHRLIGTYRRKVDLYVALTEFAKRKAIAAGLPPDRIVVRPNYVDPDPGPGTHSGGFALFVGRLAPEKGLATLMGAWGRLRTPFPLRIVGTGPMEAEVRSWAALNPNVEHLGPKTSQEVFALMQDAYVLIFPSTWYEGFGRVAIEAFATGLPVIASRLGSMEEVIADGRTGLHFAPGSCEDLVMKVEWALAHQGEMAKMGKAARQEYLAKYTGEHCERQLVSILQQAIGRASLQ